jgi:SAM-dependent methyltransferase
LNQRLGTYFARCANSLRYLNKLQDAPIQLWNDFQPEIHSILNPRETREMRKTLLPYFKNKRGVCIGGALRWEFQEYLKQAAQVINVNVGPSYEGQPTSANYLTDAANLYFARNSEFDFVCSSHVLEHLANPIKALKEWLRVTKRGGIIYCGVPDKRFTFDHTRRRTPLGHLIKDYRLDIGPYDSTHLCDVFFNTDLKLANGTQEQHYRWILDYHLSAQGKTNSSAKTRHNECTIHHHVYTKEDLTALFRYVGMEILFVTLVGDTIHLVAKKR